MAGLLAVHVRRPDSLGKGGVARQFCSECPLFLPAPALIRRGRDFLDGAGVNLGEAAGDVGS